MKPAFGRLLSSRLTAVLVFFVTLAFGASSARAQDNSSVTGVVTDPSGASVADATVTLANANIGYSLTKSTNSIGVYEFYNVPPAGGFSLTVSKDGFSTTTVGEITLNVGNKETRDVQLKIGDNKVTVEVTSTPTETLNTTDATVGSNIDGDRIQDLPNTLVNNAANYLYLAPGATQSGEVTGTRSDQTNITLDGLDVNDQRGGFAFTTTVNTPLDSIQELKVTTMGQDATYGHSAGGQMELVTKSGTNNWHGQAFEYNRVTAYTANDYFNNLNGVPNPQLIRNQFGGDFGGPILKNKLFFFFSYNGLRQVAPYQNYATVPVPDVLNGQLNYVNNLGDTVPTPLTGNNSLAQLDPLGVGADQDLLSFLQTRGYPAPNTTAVGDNVNTSGYYFVSPVRSADNTFIGRVDYQINPNHRLFVRATWDRSLDGQPPVQIFPGDPNPSQSFTDHSRSWVVGETWVISPTMTNQVSFGETNQVNAFAVTYKPTSPSSLSFFDSYYGGVLSDPYLGLNEQYPVVPVYQFRETLNWIKGKHNIVFGGVISPTIFKSGNLTDTNSYDVGIGGFLSGLTAAQRPDDFGPKGDTSEWDRVFKLVLGSYSSASSGYNYDLSGNPQPQGTVPIRDYHSTQYEAFAQDSWQVRSDFTLTYGLRWQFHKPLTEVNGYEAIQNQTPESIFSARLANSANGVSGFDAAPLITYGLGGDKNNGPGYYKPSYNNFGPRIGMAYSPSADTGWLSKLFGNRQTSIRAGFGIDYDNNLIGQGFELDETSFLFSNTIPGNYGEGDPTGDLISNPRFTCPNPCTGPALAAALPSPLPPGTTPRPTYTPNVDQNGNPIGFFNGGFGQGAFFNFDPNYKTPYEMHFSLGIQRQLPGNWLVEADYVGKLGRRLPALGDPAQTLNFKDAASGQSLYTAYGAVQKQIQNGATVTNQPWFENQMSAALAQYGQTCASANAAFLGTNSTSCTQLAAGLAGFYFYDGDLSSTILSLADAQGLSGTLGQGLLLPNVGLLSQNGAAGFIGNYSSSNYNALIIRVNHRLSHDLTIELNYTYSHSIDNDSGVQNALIDFSTSEVCDLRDLRVCRGSSDFDHRHLLAANYEYELPFGTGKRFGHDSSKLLNEVIGGWKWSGIFTAYSGSPFKIDSGAYTIDFTQTQPAVFVGTPSDVKAGIHEVPGSGGGAATLQYFSNSTNALGAFTFPIAGGPGNRNIVSGPALWNLDTALLKDFQMPWSESHKLQFRVDAINVFNHPNFENPGYNSSQTSSLLVPGIFGNLTATVNGARVLQLGLRYMF
jgi:Carboxypeptidase regulatory-like domain